MREEIERMKNEAEAHASEDSAKREMVEARNQAEQLIYATRKSLEEHGEKVSAETRSSIESAVTNLEDKVKGDDKPALDAAMKQLSDASLELGKAVYEATSAEAGQAEAGPAGDSEGGSGADDEVIDAEFEVKDEK